MKFLSPRFLLALPLVFTASSAIAASSVYTFDQLVHDGDNTVSMVWNLTTGSDPGLGQSITTQATLNPWSDPAFAWDFSSSQDQWFEALSSTGGTSNTGMVTADVDWGAPDLSELDSGFTYCGSSGNLGGLAGLYPIYNEEGDITGGVSYQMSFAPTGSVVNPLGGSSTAAITWSGNTPGINLVENTDFPIYGMEMTFCKVPEPSASLLLLVAGLGLTTFRRRARS